MSFHSHWACLRSFAGPSVGVWLFIRLIILCFHFLSNVFSFVLQTKLGLPHPLVLRLTHYICGLPLDLVGIHFLCYAHGGEKTASHDVVWDAFVSVTRDARFHVLQEQTHILPLLPFL